MITTITRYPPTFAERLWTLGGGAVATLLLALGAFLVMDSPTTPDASYDRAFSSSPIPGSRPGVIVIVARRGTD